MTLVTLFMVQSMNCTIKHNLTHQISNQTMACFYFEQHSKQQCWRPFMKLFIIQFMIDLVLTKMITNLIESEYLIILPS